MQRHFASGGGLSPRNTRLRGQSITEYVPIAADDHSLMFYKRRGVPKAGDMSNDRRVTEVYTGFENETYIHSPVAV